MMALLLCFTSCKKIEDADRITFAKLIFQQATKYNAVLYVKYDGVRYLPGYIIPVAYGKKRFEAYIGGSDQKILDTVLTVDGSKNYFIYQLDSTIAPVVLDYLPTPPPPPPPPKTPLEDEPAAPEGYMKIKIVNEAANIFSYVKMDVVINTATYDSGQGKNILTPIATMQGVGTSYNNDFFLVKRVFKGKNAVTFYLFTFINPITGEIIKNGFGDPYADQGGIDLNENTFNNFMIKLHETDFTPVPELHNIAIKKGDKYYNIEAMMEFEN